MQQTTSTARPRTPAIRRPPGLRNPRTVVRLCPPCNRNLDAAPPAHRPPGSRCPAAGSRRAVSWCNRGSEMDAGASPCRAVHPQALPAGLRPSRNRRNRGSTKGGARGTGHRPTTSRSISNSTRPSPDAGIRFPVRRPSCNRGSSLERLPAHVDRQRGQQANVKVATFETNRAPRFPVHADPQISRLPQDPYSHSVFTAHLHPPLVCPAAADVIPELPVIQPLALTRHLHPPPASPAPPTSAAGCRRRRGKVHPTRP